MSGTPKKTSSSPYQVLGNRPIDQWKVTELREELKSRKLVTRGLKDDLVKRLDEALRTERESARAEAEASLNGADEDEAQAQDTGDNADTPGPEKDTDKSAEDLETPQKVDDSKVERTDDDCVKVNSVDSQPALSEQNVEASDVTIGQVSGGDDVVIVSQTTVETITETVVSEISFSMQDRENDQRKSQLENEGSKSDIGIKEIQPIKAGGVGFSIPGESLGSKGMDAYNLKNIETEDQVPTDAQEDKTGNDSFPVNQVSEVSPSLGLEVKSDSISSDFMSINETNELKDNIIADNVKLELNVELEMVKPSSMNVAPDASGSCPMDVEDPHEKKVFADEKDGNAPTFDKTSVDVECSEKLHLDRSYGDHSMDEDASDKKQTDAKNMFGDKTEQVEVEIKDEVIVDVVSEEKEDSHVEDKGVIAADKRKPPDQQIAGKNEPVKRQRRWNNESVKLNVPQVTTAAVTTTSRESISPLVAKCNVFRSDSTNSEDATKERVVPPSANPPTNSLRIDNFLRPFTLKAVQELLCKTGKVTSFWMDQIKTHCYVTYSSVEEATETRNAVYNLQWPTNGGRLLVADFVDPQEVKNRIEAPPPSPAAPVTPHPQAAVPKHLRPSQMQVQRQQAPLPTSIPPPPQLSVPPPSRALPPPPPEELDPPIVTLDDLFRKTTTTPRIYYLPLSEEQVAIKLAARGKIIKT